MATRSSGGSPLPRWWTGTYAPGDVVVVRVGRGRYLPAFVPPTDDADVARYAADLPDGRMVVRYYNDYHTVVVAVRKVHREGHRGVTAGNQRAPRMQAPRMRAPRMEAPPMQAPPMRAPRVQAPRMKASSGASSASARSLTRRQEEASRERAGLARGADLGVEPLDAGRGASASERSFSARDARAAARQVARAQAETASRAGASAGGDRVIGQARSVEALAQKAVGVTGGDTAGDAAREGENKEGCASVTGMEEGGGAEAAEGPAGADVASVEQE